MMKPYLKWKIPVYTVSEANCSEHWTKKKKRHESQKKWIKLSFWNSQNFIFKLPCIIKMTRKGKKVLDDDNLPVSMKYIRDAIADHLFPGQAPGQADNDKRIKWEYDQIKSKEIGVIVEFFVLE